MPGLFRVASEAIIEKDGKILITKRAAHREHAPNEWETLTGRIEQGETFEEGLKREVKEEVGLEVEVIQPFYTFHFFRGPQKEEHLGVSFWCMYKSGNVKLNKDEQSEFQWVTVKQALALIRDKSIKKSLLTFQKLLEEKLTK
jgi:8-oxo-dGTP diphosphatase